MSAWLTIVGDPSHPAVGQAEFVLGPERVLFADGPHPASPTRGEVPPGGSGTIEQKPRERTLPLVGRAGEGPGPQLIAWCSPLESMLAQVESLRGKPTVIIATGDPMWFGIGATLASRLDASEFEVHPGASAFQLAAARLRWPLQHVTTLSLHGRPIELLHPHLTPGNRIVALTTDASTVTRAIELLDSRGYGQSIVTVLENLGSPDERIGRPPARSDFVVLAIDCVADRSAALLPPVPGLPDDAFVSDGQLTKRDVRAATIARLAPYPGALLWDVGAGCGSVAIEWMRAARDTRAIAFEREGERLQMIAVNARQHGVPGLQIENGDAPASFAGMPSPDAVFLGGGVADEALFEAAWGELRPGGRLVANAVTIEGEEALYRRQSRHGGELVRIDVSVMEPLASHRVLRPKMAVTQWLAVKP